MGIYVISWNYTNAILWTWQETRAWTLLKSPSDGNQKKRGQKQSCRISLQLLS